MDTQADQAMDTTDTHFPIIVQFEDLSFLRVDNPEGLPVGKTFKVLRTGASAEIFDAWREGYAYGKEHGYLKAHKEWELG